MYFFNQYIFLFIQGTLNSDFVSICLLFSVKQSEVSCVHEKATHESYHLTVYSFNLFLFFKKPQYLSLDPRFQTISAKYGWGSNLLTKSRMCTFIHYWFTYRRSFQKYTQWKSAAHVQSCTFVAISKRTPCTVSWRLSNKEHAGFNVIQQNCDQIAAKELLDDFSFSKEFLGGKYSWTECSVLVLATATAAILDKRAVHTASMLFFKRAHLGYYKWRSAGADDAFVNWLLPLICKASWRR